MIRVEVDNDTERCLVTGVLSEFHLKDLEYIVTMDGEVVAQRAAAGRAYGSRRAPVTVTVHFGGGSGSGAGVTLIRHHSHPASAPCTSPCPGRPRQGWLVSGHGYDNVRDAYEDEDTGEAV